jgi:hypothetical protein
MISPSRALLAIAMPRGDSVGFESSMPIANAPFLCPAGVGLRPESSCRVIHKTDTKTTVVFGFPLESPVPEVLGPQPALSPAHNPDCGISQPHTISPEQQNQPCDNLQSESEPNDALGTVTTKNATAKAPARSPVFIGTKAEKDTDLGAGHEPECDSASPERRQNQVATGSGSMSVTYIGPVLRRIVFRDAP